MYIDYPFHFDGLGRTATTSAHDHARDLIEQLLFTSPGERVNRPDFGCGLLRMVFAPNSPELAATVQFTTRAALQRWLGDVIDIKGVQVSSEDATVRVLVQYAMKQTGELHTDTFERSALP